ncbi:MAG: NAD-binding protein [Phormidesmis sp.]
MYLIVVGAEAEGRRLIEMAVNSSHEVTLIEADPYIARLVLKNLCIRVFNGMIADDKILDEA